MDPTGHVISADRDRRQISRRSTTDIKVVETVLANNWMERYSTVRTILVMDAAGGIFFTDPDYEGRGSTPEALYYLDPAGALSRLVTFSTSTSTTRPINKRPNGVALSPDGAILYLAVELNNRIMAYDVGPGGSLSNERLFARTDVNAAGTALPGINNGPDGIAIDASGNVYCAVKNAVFAWSPAGHAALRSRRAARSNQPQVWRRGRADAVHHRLHVALRHRAQRALAGARRLRRRRHRHRRRLHRLAQHTRCDRESLRRRRRQ